ncbi:MAG: flagellar basal body rod protein FlgB [Clostridiales bacterium]|jgi:flagellar basal-body rod protein FlgB|nr:flagellar basal body rod protein FlgB [Clostridiales bacterium]
MFESLFKTANYLQKGLDATSLRHQVITNNIANAETPDFKSSSVEFETIFQNALNGDNFVNKITRDKHRAFSPAADVDEIHPVVILNETTEMRMDGNNVDPDFQQAELAKNQILQNAYVEKLNGEYRRLGMAIREGR